LILFGASLAMVGLVVLPALLGHHDEQEKKERPIVSVPVTVATVETRPVERWVGIVGTLEGYEEVAISAKIEGRIARLYRELGDTVAPGEKLADLEDTDLRLAVAEAERGLELELTRLGLTKLQERLDLSQVAMVSRARAIEENARSIYERARKLGAGRGIGLEELEKTQADYRVASANRQQAELDALATLAAARQKKAQLDIALQRLADAHLVAPAVSPERLPPGLSPAKLRWVVASRKVAEGQMVRANQTELFRLVIDQPLKLVAALPERYSAEVRVEQPVRLEVEAYPGLFFEGKVVRVNPTIDRLSRTFTVEVLVDNRDRRLRAGGFTKARIQTRAAEKVLCVPEQAVNRFAGEVKVFVIENDKARTVPVRTGEVLPGAERWIEVIGSLKPGEQVALSGQAALANGTPVRVR
ncbi:MAG: efflux RND transporter periplasmic adaptor subunit, partial [Gemmataceae bacterium]